MPDSIYLRKYSYFTPVVGMLDAETLFQMTGQIYRQYAIVPEMAL
jgi:hypothetical protein